MATRQYIGARYTIKIYENSLDPSNAEWESGHSYEPLTMVQYNNDTYLSKKEVPQNIGDPASNPTYWVVTGFYNGQISALQDEIDDILAMGLGSAMFYFPSISTGTFQSASCMMVVDKKATIFDCGAANSKSEMMDFYDSLYNAGVFDNVDNIIISHYHHDHMENIGDIFNAYPHVNCDVYIPLDPTGYYADAIPDGLIANRNTIITECTNAGATYTEISLNTTLTINDLVTIDLFNSTAGDYTYYSSINSDYNNYSMCALVKVGHIYAMFSGDIQYDGETHIIAQRKLPRLFLYAVNHHGLQWDDNVAFMNQIAPEWGVCQISPNKNRNIDGLLPKYCVSHVCSSAYSSHIFAMDKDSGFIVSGDEVQSFSGNVPSVKIYVNNEYTLGDNDGSALHPFNEINDALRYAKKSGVTNKIYVIATGTTYETIRGSFIDDVYIEGVPSGGYTKPTINGFHFEDCTSITLYKLIFSEMQSIDSAIGYFSDCEYANVAECDFVGTPAASPKDYSIRNLMSNVYVHSCSFTEVRGLSSVVYGTFYVGSNTFTNCGFCYTLYNTKYIIKALDTVTDTSTYITGAAEGSSPFEVSANLSGQLTAVQNLMALNNALAFSEPFLIGSTLYKVRGTSVIAE